MTARPRLTGPPRGWLRRHLQVLAALLAMPTALGAQPAALAAAATPGVAAVVGAAGATEGAGTARAAASARTAATACGAAITGPGRLQAQAEGWQVVFAPRTWPLPVGRHFEVDFAVCAPPGRPAPTALRVDADMPAHRHGMNYRATLRTQGDGRYLGSGLLLHMPGRWRFVFDLQDGERSVRLTHEVEVE